MYAAAVGSCRGRVFVEGADWDRPLSGSPSHRGIPIMRHGTSWTQVLCVNQIHYAKGLSSSCPSSPIILPLMLSPFKQPRSFHRLQRRCTCLHALLLLFSATSSLAPPLPSPYVSVWHRHLAPLHLIIPHCPPPPPHP